MRSARRRRGAVIFVLLAVFAVTMTLASVWARRIVAERRGQRNAAERVQVQWLAEAGVRRAAAQLAANPEYTGEEWSIPSEELGRDNPASVVLRVEPNEDEAGRYRLTAVARYPQQGPRVKITKTVEFTPQNPEPEP